MEDRFRRALSSLRGFGIDPVKTFVALQGFPHFVKSLLVWSIKHKGKIDSFSISTSDVKANAGSGDGHYFWQDLIVAKWIIEESPKTHFDVGSRVDGFIAHLLTSREVIQLDIRENEVEIPGLSFEIGDAQFPLSHLVDKYDSVSSLHSIEHFGLGRYGDQIDPDGHIKGLTNIAGTVKIGGKLYVSFPIGQPRVEFNSQRILDPRLPQEILPNFELLEFVIIPWKGLPVWNSSPEFVDLSIFGQAGIYKFRRNA